MKALILSIAAAVCLSAAAAPALAQEEDEPAASGAVDARAARAAEAKGRDRGMKDAPGLMAQSGRACTVSDAVYRGSGKNKNAAGKTVNTDVYEVVCQEGLGFILVKAGDEVSANDCLQFETAAEQVEDKAKATRCTLPANATPAKGMQPLITHAGVNCDVQRARWSGFSPSQKVNQYEVVCADQNVYMMTVPMSGSTLKLAANNCVQVSSGCKLLPADQMVTRIAAMAAPANRQCQPTQARYVGTTPDGRSFYEVGCSDEKAGFMFEMSAQNQFTRAIDCARASMISGGCTFTNAAVAEEGQADVYTGIVRKAGYNCDVASYRSIGLDQQKREVVELVCKDAGLSGIGFLPVDAGQKAEFYNCVRAEARSIRCGLVPQQATYSRLSTQISSKGKTCQVSGARGLGSDASGSDYVEVACAGSSGFVVKYGPGTDAVQDVIACSSAKGIGGGCKLAQQ